MTTTTHNLTRGLLVALAVTGAMATLAGCRGDRSEKPPRQFFPDMDDSPKWKPQSHSDFYEDGREMRPELPGTVPFGTSMDPNDPARASVLREDVAFFTGKSADGKFVAKIPPSFKVDAKSIERGQQRFNIYCSACHGFDGAASGTVAPYYNPVPANFHNPVLMEAGQNFPLDGYVFSVIRNGLWDVQGKMRMPSYGPQIKEYDAWAVTAYVGTLQAWRAGTRADVPEAILQDLDRRSSAAPTSTSPAATTPAAPTAPATTPPAAPAPEKKP